MQSDDPSFVDSPKLQTDRLPAFAPVEYSLNIFHSLRGKKLKTINCVFGSVWLGHWEDFNFFFFGLFGAPPRIQNSCNSSTQYEICFFKRVSVSAWCRSVIFAHKTCSWSIKYNIYIYIVYTSWIHKEMEAERCSDTVFGALSDQV